MGDFDRVASQIDEMRASTISGATMPLSSGAMFDFLNPEASQLTIEDVAYCHGYDKRFAGQCRERATGKHVFYSVAEHCYRMSWAIEGDPDFHPRDEYDALMHELDEVPGGDMVAPLKQHCPDFRAITKRIGKANEKRFHVRMRDPLLIKRYDLRMLATEKRDLTMRPVTEEWTFIEGQEPLPDVIRPWGPDMAAQMFLERYRCLIERYNIPEPTNG